MNVLIIPEDFRKDQFVLKPIIKAMLENLGKPRAKVEVCKDPLLSGVSEALKWERVREVIEMYPMVHLFLLVVDRDGNEHRVHQFKNLEESAEKILTSGKILFGENAWQEIEVWALAGQDDLPWPWREVRAEVHPKETYFEPYAKSRGVENGPGGGRKTLAEESAKKYGRVRQFCEEDIVRLEERIAAWMSN